MTSSAPVTDVDGNTYSSIKIGTQVWLAENLKTTKYNDGSKITLVTDNNSWANLFTEAYCWYNNDQLTYGNTYGALYNWYAVNTGKLCPTGWHVPSDDEWKTLEINLGMTQAEANIHGSRGTDEGGKLKETGTMHWNSPNTGATNESGFTALPGGYRITGSFFNNGYWGIWHTTSTELISDNGWTREMFHNQAKIWRRNGGKDGGFSVRCLRND